MNGILGAERAADRMNERGSLKVGGERYLIKLAKCDNQYTGSEAVCCADLLIHDEGVKFMILGMGAVQGNAVAPVAEENEVMRIKSLIASAAHPFLNTSSICV